MQDHPKWKGHLQRSSKMWSTELGNRKPLQYSCCQNPINSMKRQKYMTLEDESLRSDSVQYSTWEVQRAITLTPQRMKQLGKSLTTLKMLTLIKKKNVPRKESYEECRQYIKKQRRHFANKGLYSQS